MAPNSFYEWPLSFLLHVDTSNKQIKPEPLYNMVRYNNAVLDITRIRVGPQIATPEPLYNTVRYNNMVLDITWIRVGPQIAI